MRPILYAAGTTTFTGTGLGVLCDTVSAEVTEERNGKFELELEYPVGSALADQLVLGNIIAVKAGLDSRPNQAFEIYKVSKDLGGIITVNAQHVTYKASLWYYVEIRCSAGDTVQEALQNMLDYTSSLTIKDDSPFTISTDISETIGAGRGIVSTTGPHSLKSIIWPESSGEAESSGEEISEGVERMFNMLSIFGIADADIWPDNYNIGINNPKEWSGLVFRYGVNIKDFSSELDGSDTVSGVLGYVQYDYNSATMYTYATTPITTIGTNPVKSYELVDLSGEFDDPSTATAEQIQQAVDDYITSQNYTGIPVANIKIDYVDGTGLEKACLLDKVNVIIPGLDVDAEETIVKVVFDVLNERINSMELGKLKTYVIGG